MLQLKQHCIFALNQSHSTPLLNKRLLHTLLAFLNNFALFSIKNLGHYFFLFALKIFLILIQILLHFAKSLSNTLSYLLKTQLSFELILFQIKINIHYNIMRNISLTLEEWFTTAEPRVLSSDKKSLVKFGPI